MRLSLILFSLLIAGTFIQFKDIQNQFIKIVCGEHTPQLALGLIFFVIGFSKEVFLADMLSPTADTGFMYAKYESAIPPAMATLATLSYALQLYFDFSGYADMIIGLGFHSYVAVLHPFLQWTLNCSHRNWRNPYLTSSLALQSN